MSEGEVLDVQQSSPVEVPAEPAGEAQVAESQTQQPAIEAQGEVEAEHDGDAEDPHPLEPGGKRFKQVVAARHKEKERAERIEAELQREREERIRLEERLKAQVEAKKAATPEYTWEQLQAAVDNQQITMAKAMEIREQQLYQRWERDVQAREEKARVLSSVGSEIEQYRQLVPNAAIRGTEEAQKVDREYGYLVQRMGEPKTQEAELSMRVAAARAAFGDIESLRTKQQLASKPLPKEPFMETSSASKKPADIKKDYKSTLSPREVQHYERLFRTGRYPNGWADVQKENETYAKIKAGQV